MERKLVKTGLKIAGLVLVTFALGACQWSLDPLEAADVGTSLTMAGWEAWNEAEANGSPPATVEFSGAYGGTATFVFSEATPGYSGTVTFSDFVMRDGLDDTYTIIGSAEIFADYNGELMDFDLTYEGTLSIAKDGGGEAFYELDLGISHDVQLPGEGPGEDLVKMNGSATGTINGEDAGVDFSTDFVGTYPY